MDGSERPDRLAELARIAREVAAECGREWEYAAVVIRMRDEHPEVVPVLVRPESES